MATPLHPILQPIEAVVGDLDFDTQGFLVLFQRKSYRRGEAWLEEGGVCRGLVFVESGLLRHIRCDDKGEPRTRWATLPGQFGTQLPSLVSGSLSEDRIEAVEPTILYEISKADWADQRAEHPQLQAFWVAMLEYQLLCFEDRVWSLISGDAESRYRYMIARYPDFLLQLPQHYVADMLGIALRHLSRIRAQLARDLKPAP